MHRMCSCIDCTTATVTTERGDAGKRDEGVLLGAPADEMAAPGDGDGLAASREGATLAALRSLMAAPSHTSAYPGARAPMWTSKCFMGEFGDCFVQDTDLEGGRTEQSLPEYTGVVGEALARFAQALPLIDDDAREAARRVIAKLNEAAAVANELNACGGWEAEAFGAFLQARSRQVRALAVGDFLLWCGGWSGVSGGHAIMYLVERTGDDEAAFVTLNTGQGVGYHPDYAAGYPKQKRLTQMRLPATLAKMSDTSWLYMLFKIQAGGHKDHTPKVLYEVCLPALVGSSLVQACADAPADPHAIAETLQRSGVCYYRCILTATRYSLRKLGCRQEQVKQLLHVVRRTFVARVAEDLSSCRSAVEAGFTASASVQRGLYPSQLRLVRLAAEMLGYSAVKESKAGRMDASTLESVVAEVEHVGAVAAALPLVGAGDDTNDWMLPQQLLEPAVDGAGAGGFVEAAACAHSVGADLSSFAGGAVDAAPHVQVDFCALPSSRVELHDASALDTALHSLRRLCKAIRANEDVRLNARLLQIASLMEHTFTVLLPMPTWAAPESPWHAPDLKSFQSMRDNLHWCANEYAATCLSMPIPEAAAVRALTSAAITCSFFEVVRAGPAQETCQTHGDAVVARMLRDEGLGFPTSTRAGEAFAAFTGSMPLDTAELASSRASLCDYMYSMETTTSGQVFGFCVASEWAIGGDEPAIRDTLGLVEQLAKEGLGRGKFAKPDKAVFKAVIGPRQKIHQLTDVQRGAAWLLRPISGSGNGFEHLDTWLFLRDMVTLYVFSISSMPSPASGLGRGQIFKHKDGADDDDAKAECAAVDTIGFDFSKPNFDDKFETCKFGRTLEGSAWDSAQPSPQYALSLADPRAWVEKETVTPAADNENEAAYTEINEDDVLHTPQLPDFDGSLSQEEAELLFSFLTVPYLRIPLVLQFFCQRSIGALFNAQLRDLLWHVLFCPGTWGAAQSTRLCIETVPCPSEVLSTDRGLLMAELECGPTVSLGALMKLLHAGIRLAVGDFESSFVPVLLYLVRLAVRMLAYLRSADETRAVAVLDTLEQFDSELASWLEEAAPIVHRWRDEAATQQRRDAECAMQAHLALLVWTCTDPDVHFDERMAQRLVACCAFVNTWNALGDREAEPQDTATPSGESNLKGSTALGVSDQEMFWLVQHKRRYLQTYLLDIEDEDTHNILACTIRTATGEAGLEWQAPESVDGNTVCAEAEKAPSGATISFVDGEGMFSVNVQIMTVTYRSSRLTPVPDTIARHSDFFSLFNGSAPHCATVSQLSHRHVVFIPQGQKLVEYWQPCESRLGFPGCPGSGGDEEAGAGEVLETSHPYTEADVMSKRTISFPATTKSITLRFDPRSATSRFYDGLKLTWTDERTGRARNVEFTGTPSDFYFDDDEEQDEDKDGEMRFCQPLTIFASKFTAEFGVMSGYGDCWGFRLQASATEETTGVSLNFNGSSYGGDGREYCYGGEAHADVPWLGTVLDPVLFSELTKPNKREPSRLEWTEFPETETTADKLVYMLPEAGGDYSEEVSLLSLSGEMEPGQQFWRLLRVSRQLQTVQVFVIDLFGRRAFPCQVYSSDSRMCLCASFTAKPGASEVVHPPRSIVRFARGDFLRKPSGGHDVLIFDKSVDPAMLRLPERVLLGVLSHALVTGLEFWEDQDSGHLRGRRLLQKRDQKADAESNMFVDPYFNYELEARPAFVEGAASHLQAVRIDEDPATLARTARRLVNLASGWPQLVALLTQIESLSHILAWTSPVCDADAAHALVAEEILPVLVELPRLQLRFTVTHENNGEVALFLADRAGTRVLPERSTVDAQLLDGVSRCLVLTTTDSVEILVRISTPTFRRSLTRVAATCNL